MWPSQLHEWNQSVIKAGVTISGALIKKMNQAKPLLKIQCKAINEDSALA